MCPREESNEIAIQEIDEQTDLLFLVEIIARTIIPSNPISHWKKPNLTRCLFSNVEIWVGKQNLRAETYTLYSFA